MSILASAVIASMVWLDGYYHPKFFNIGIEDIAETDTRFIVSRGGAGSGKSYNHHQHELLNLKNCEGDVLLIRKHATDLEESSYKLFQTIAKSLNIYDHFKWRYYSDKRDITHIETGRKILLKGIDDSEKIKSITGIQRVLIEEASELTFNDFLEVNRRARGYPNVQISLLLNPINENHWIKTKLLDGEGYKGRVTEFHTTYHNNKFLDADYIIELEALKGISENHYDVYVLGLWGVEDKAGKFAYAFSKKKHVKTGVAYDPAHLVTLSFDFNRDPITCGVIQDIGCIRVIEAIELEDSDIYKMCDYIRAAYPNALFVVNGDATGRASTALVKDKLNYYRVIRMQLGLSLAQIQVPTINPVVKENRVLVNCVLMNYPVEIDEKKGEALIYDLRYVEVDETGAIKKDRSSDKKKADSIDWFRYYLNQNHKHLLRMPQKRDAA